MKIILISSFPLVDRNPYKINFIKELIKLSFIDDMILIYTHSSLLKHYTEFIKRLKEKSIKSTDVKNLGFERVETLSKVMKSNSLPVYYFNYLKDFKCQTLIKEFRPDLIFNLSGIYIPKYILGAPKIGVIGAHYAKLPEIRGRDTIRWSIYLNYPMYVSHMFLAPELDLGDIILLSKVRVQKGDTIIDIRKNCQVKNFEGNVKILRSIQEGTLISTKQKPEEGTTYYTMGNFLSKKVDNILKNNEYKYYEQ